jgi:hypothetical protein
MKKLILTLAIVLGLGLTTFAQGGGLFQRGASETTDGVYGDRGMRDGFPGLPGGGGHGGTGNADAPIGSGAAVLIGLGAAYLVGKRRKEE